MRYVSGEKIKKRDGLVKNTAMLYVLTISNYVFGFATIPYLTRILGPESYGVIGFALAVVTYFQLFLDFGFMLSATARIADSGDDKEGCSNVVSSVLLAKVILSIVALVVGLILCAFVKIMRANVLLFIGFFLYAIVNSFIPDFYYRGVEKMRIVTYRTVFIKAFFLVCIFLFVHSSDDLLLIPLFYLLGSLVAVFSVFYHMVHVERVSLLGATIGDAIKALQESAFYFVSRIASTFYSSLNTIVVGGMYPGTSLLGNYTATDRAIAAGKTLASPVADSIFPLMVRRKNFRLLVGVSVIAFCFAVLVCVPCWIYAYPICSFVFGEAYYDAGIFLRLMLPVVPITVISLLYGFPALSPLGKASIANGSVVVGALFQVAILICLYLAGKLDAYSICISTVAAEFVVMAIRMVSFLYYYRIKKAE